MMAAQMSGPGAQSGRSYANSIQRRARPSFISSLGSPFMTTPICWSSVRLLVVVGLLLMCGGGSGFRIAKNQFQKDSRGRPNEEAALTELPQLHSRIQDTEAIQLAAHAVMIGKTKAHVVDGLTRTIGRTPMARNQMHDRGATG